MEAISFILSGKTAHFKKPDVNSYAYFTYNNIHKPALCGLLGAVLGLEGYTQLFNKVDVMRREVLELKGKEKIDLKEKLAKKEEEFPEYYEKLRNLQVSIKPLSPNGYFNKKIQIYNNSVGYASKEQGGNLIVREQWLENPRWQILILDDNCVEREIFSKLKDFLINSKTEFIPYLGKNDHPAKIEDAKIISMEEVNGDFAGIKASLRGIDMVLSEGMNVKIVLLPDGEDPDSFSKKMKFDEFQKYIDENEQDFIKFKTKLLIEDAQDDPVKKATHISDIVKSISVIDNIILRAEYIKECSTILKIREEVLYAEVKKRASSKFANKQAYSNKQNNQNSFNKPAENPNTATNKTINVPIERDIIYYMLNYGDSIVYEDAETKEKQTAGEYIVAHITNDELIFKSTTYHAIFEEYSNMLSNSIVPKAAHFISHIKNEISTAATDIISPEQELSKIWTKNGATVTSIENQIAEIVPDIVDKFKLKNVQFKLVQILEEIKNIPFDADGQELIQLLDEYKTYDEYKIALTKQIDKSALL